MSDSCDRVLASREKTTTRQDDLPVIISAYGGAPYYYQAAKQLARDCERLGLRHDFMEWHIEEGEDWGQICRRKINSYLKLMMKHRSALLWVDIDTRIIRAPDFVRGLKADFGAFLRNFKYVRDFDPHQASRMFAPAFLYFNHTEACISFLELMNELERASGDLDATDDYFLQEAWLAHKSQLDLAIFAPHHVAFSGKAENPKASLLVGISGNVKDFVDKVEQHKPTNLTVPRQVHVLKHLAIEARKAKNAQRALSLSTLAAELDPADQEAVVEVSRNFAGTDRMERVRQLMRSHEHGWESPYTARRRWIDMEIQHGDAEAAAQMCLDLLQSPAEQDRNFAQSRLYRASLERRARTAGLSRVKRPKLWWMESPFPGNFGDILNPYIVEKMTGLPPLMVQCGRHNLVIGSVIKFAQAGTSVWGTGTPRMTDVLNPAADYRAVRGPLSRELVLRSGGDCPNVFGDVAAFLPMIYNPEVRKTHRLGLIRHSVHRQRPLSLHGVKEIEILCVGDDGIERFIRDVLSCESIISTSLHGLIVAHAYGIPAEWGAFSDGGAAISGDGTKFQDYFGSVGLAEHAPMELSQLDELSDDRAAPIRRLPERPIDLKALAKASPFRLLERFT